MDINTLEEKLGIANLSDAEKLALVKGIESNVQASKAAVKAQEAGQYASLVVDAIKRIKNDLETRFNELNGIIDVKAKSLQDGKDGIDGKNGKDGRDGRDGKDGISITGPKGDNGADGVDGVGVQDAYIDFDGSLIIKLTDGTEINVGEVVPMDVAEKIKIIGNGGGTSQSVLDSLTSLQDQINTLTGIDGTLGTMAQQDANAVAITGGTINGTTVGATTAAAGTFTTLTATGQTSLGGAPDSESLRVFNVASAVNYLTARGATSGSSVTLGAAGLNGGIATIVQSKGSAGVELWTNGGNQRQFVAAHTASAVNYVQVTGAATGANPAISIQGSDANRGFQYWSKGSGAHLFYSNSGANLQFRIDSSNSSVNYLQAQGTATTFGPVLASVGSDTNIPLVLQPKGTGALQAQQTDSTATGGNARGANAVDWQMLRNAASKVASNAYAVIAGGSGNTAAGFAGTVSGGTDNSSGSGNYNVIAGGYLNTGSQSNTAIVGGYGNTASGYFNFIGGGAANSGTSGSAVTTQSATMNGTTAVTLSAPNANIKVGQLITGTSITVFPYTYVAAISGTSLTLSQAASGSSTSTLSFSTPHGVVVGGGNNQATGSYSFIGGGGDAGTAANRNVASGDWSTVAGGVKNTATGRGSFIGGGGLDSAGNISTNTASGTSSVLSGGRGNTASGDESVVLGGVANISNGLASIVGGRTTTARGITANVAFSGSYSPISGTGSSQFAFLVLARQTTDATATVLTNDGGSASTTNQVILPNNSAYFFKGEVIAGVTGGGNTKGWTIEGVIKRGANAASTTVVGVTVMSSYGDAGAVTWTIAAAADTTNGGLKITATGQAATTIRWVCKIETTEMTY